MRLLVRSSARLLGGAPMEAHAPQGPFVAGADWSFMRGPEHTRPVKGQRM